MKIKTRPLIFSLITSFCFLEPLAKLFYFKLSTNFEWKIILTNLLSRNSLEDITHFWLLFPVTGFLLLKIRVWSYCLFMLLMGYNVYSLISYEAYTWPYNAHSPHAYNFVLTLVCLTIIVTFCFPKIRKPFFDRRSRWWEPQKRHSIFLEAELRTPLDTIHAVITNISTTGAFVLNLEVLNIGERFVVTFRILEEVFISEVEVIHKLDNGTINGYGVKFIGMSLKSRDTLSRVLKEWEAINVPTQTIKKQLAS